MTLTATADAGYKFVGWTGGTCNGTGSCTLTVSAEIVTAQFQKENGDDGNNGDGNNGKPGSLRISDCSEEAKFRTHGLYRAYYNRCADFLGFDFWCKQLGEKGGGTDLKLVIVPFGYSNEYRNRFVDLSPTERIKGLYLSMYDREPEKTTGLDYYVKCMDELTQEWYDLHDDSERNAEDAPGRARAYAESQIALKIYVGTRGLFDGNPPGKDSRTLRAKINKCPQY